MPASAVGNDEVTMVREAACQAASFAGAGIHVIANATSKGRKQDLRTREGSIVPSLSTTEGDSCQRITRG